jgi:drug/metabolite transporter (DMT)-like permease
MWSSRIGIYDPDVAFISMRETAMSTTAIALWLLTIALDAGGQLTFKAAAGDPNGASGLAQWRHMGRLPWMWIGITCYVFEFILWLAFLSLVPLSVCVLMASINIVVVMIAGRIVFAERITPLRLASIALIAIGVATVGLG